MRQLKHIVDVRTQQEFNGGHAEGAINIPLHEIPSRLDELKQMAHPIVLCCASGARSGQALLYLKQQGIENCHNAGPWILANNFNI